MGTLTLRYVSPWINESGKLIGYIELGIDLPNLIQKLKTFENSPSITVFNKRDIEKKHWQTGESIFKEHRLDWNLAKDQLFIAYLLNATTLQQITQQPDYLHSSLEWIPISIENQQQTTIAELFVQSPYTLWKKEALTNAIVSSAIITAMILLVISFVLHFVRRIRQSDKNLHQAVAELNHMATHDALTKLYNRNYLFAQLEAYINSKLPNPAPFYICLLDIDHFKKINDQHFHGFGDLVLTAFADYLIQSLPQAKWLSRAGGDQFIFVLEHQTQQAIQHALQPLKRFLCFQEDKYKTLEITSSIGVSFIDLNKESTSFCAEQAFHQAELAMLDAKQNGKQTSRFFQPELVSVVQREIKIENALKQAIENQELTLYFQKKYDLFTQQTTGVEALVRWPQAEGGFISPGEFIPIAEKSRLIIELDSWVFNAACKQYLKWQNEGTPTQININLSGRYLMEMNIEETILHQLERLNIPPKDFGIEITEHHIMTATSDHIQKIDTLKKAGIAVYLDDFGTGYSSLSYVQNFPISILKIDQSFVKNAPNNAKDFGLMKAIISMGHALDLKVIAEGIETQEHEQVARSLGCDLGQGYFYHRPQPPEAIEF